MSKIERYPKRLIEVDLPIARISAHARREKSIRHGHISTLHIWWARRPLAACRAVICASLWPDPADELCPPTFREAAVEHIKAFARRVFPDKLREEGQLLSSEKHCSPESRARWEAIARGTLTLDASEPVDLPILRLCLLDFIADFANWDNSTVPAFLETSRALTQAAHESLGGILGTRPLVIDPFAGGGSIPLESLRVGADAFASDLNPVPVLLNKVVLEYIPKYGKRLADEVRKWGEWITQEAAKELVEFYPDDPDGATPITYLWARTIQCEGPGCGAEVPLVRSLWLAKKANRSVALRIIPNLKQKCVDFDILVKQPKGWVSQSDPSITLPDASVPADGTVKRGSATCPCCGYTTPVNSVRAQLKSRRGGSHDSRLMAVVTTRSGEQGRSYRLATPADLEAVRLASDEIERRERTSKKDGNGLSLVPDELISPNELRRISVPIYGMERWGDLFSPRQSLSLATLAHLIGTVQSKIKQSDERELSEAVASCLALTIGKHADLANALCAWEPVAECPRHLFGRQAIGIVWDYAEGVTTVASSGAYAVQVERTEHVLDSIGSDWLPGHVEQASATEHPLPDDAAAVVFTDPPYYDAVPYSHLSDFFFVWFRRALAASHPTLFRGDGTPKDAEIVVDRPHQLSKSKKDIAYYERELQKAFAECRRVLCPSGVGTIVFASKTTSSWEAILKAVVDAGWVVTGSWPIDTEMESRLAAQGQARLASSVHLVCRPREDESGAVTEAVGEWRDVLGELPTRIHEWMPRLAAEGVVGADAIFACLGPALEIFSRYSRVEKSNGETATLREYLEFVWGAVSSEALALIFKDADASGLEPDARLTAMWLWTLGGGGNGNGNADKGDGEEEKTKPSEGFTLEFDAARKIAQGLGVHLEQCESLVAITGDKAKLLPVSARTRHLFGKETAVASRRKAQKVKQRTLFEELDEAEVQGRKLTSPLNRRASRII